jgi:hypothetical protein
MTDRSGLAVGGIEGEHVALAVVLSAHEPH